MNAPLRELYDLDAESAVLGALLRDNAAYDRIVGVLSAEHFYIGDHKALFGAISALISERSAADVVSVASHLKSNGHTKFEHFDSVVEYLLDIEARSVSAVNVSVYADIVRDRALLRRTLNTVRGIDDLVNATNGLSAAQLLDAAQASLMSLGNESAGNDGLRALSDFVDQSIEEVDEAARRAKCGQVSGLATGLIALDDILNGIGDSDLVVLGGRPSHGKSALALNICEWVSVVQKQPTAFISLEMTSVQLTKRLLASQSNVHGLRLKDGRLTDEDWTNFQRASDRMRSVPIFISEKPRMNVLEISAMCRKLKRDTNGALKLIVIDYLGLMDHGVERGNRAELIERSTNALKNLAKELKTPVLLLSQVNRGCEARPNKRPTMSDLRESGGIEQDADTIMFVYRDYVYSQNPDVRFDAEIIVAKQRNGPIATATLAFDPARTRFRDHDDAQRVAA